MVVYSARRIECPIEFPIYTARLIVLYEVGLIDEYSELVKDSELSAFCFLVSGFMALVVFACRCGSKLLHVGVFC